MEKFTLVKLEACRLIADVTNKWTPSKVFSRNLPRFYKHHFKPPCSSHVLSQAPPMFSTPVGNPGLSKFLAGGETHPHPLSGENPDARTPTLPNIHQQLTQCSSILWHKCIFPTISRIWTEYEEIQNNRYRIRITKYYKSHKV